MSSRKRAVTGAGIRIGPIVEVERSIEEVVGTVRYIEHERTGHITLNVEQGSEHARAVAQHALSVDLRGFGLVGGLESVCVFDQFL
ncbi:MAG TPA: hypothetical protein PL070_12110 [Flavobacteriales bacterium]|nr:hypothetical protein [Flavobacteriales bacterium]